MYPALRKKALEKLEEAWGAVRLAPSWDVW